MNNKSDTVLHGRKVRARLSVAVIVKICLLMVMILPGSAKGLESEQKSEKRFVLKPIGTVQKGNGYDLLVLDKEVEPALRGLDGFSHVWVIWWFDLNDTPEERSVLQVHPRGNSENPLTGVFACRSPFRPNLIGLTLCRIRSVKGNIVEIDGIDAFANTPILDLKPYIPGIDSAKSSVSGWLKERQK